MNGLISRSVSRSVIGLAAGQGREVRGRGMERCLTGSL